MADHRRNQGSGGDGGEFERLRSVGERLEDGFELLGGRERGAVTGCRWLGVGWAGVMMGGLEYDEDCGEWVEPMAESEWFRRMESGIARCMGS